MNSDTAPWKSDWSEHGEISRGGQGIVTELRSLTEPTRRAVLKQILPRWKDDPQARQRLQHEAEILSKLHESGARVPKLIDSFMKHDSVEPFLLMEFIHGVRFDEWLKSQAPVKTQQAVTITRAIAETIELCHKHKIGHRDIKPSNIILKGGDSSSPYVLDFGISFDYARQ
jgi:serine/threonine protein kinase